MERSVSRRFCLSNMPDEGLGTWLTQSMHLTAESLYPFLGSIMEFGVIPVASTGYKTMSTRFSARATWVVFEVSDSEERSCPPRRDVCVELAACDDGVLLVSKDCDSRSSPPMAFTI